LYPFFFFPVINVFQTVGDKETLFKIEEHTGTI
jgi:hypothetical protein